MGGGRERGRGKGGDGVSSITNQMLWTAGIGVPFPWDSAPSRSPRLRYSHCVSNRFRKVRTFFVLHIQSWRRQICSDGPTERPRDAVRKTTRGSLLIKSTLATQLTHTGERPGRISQSVLVRTSLAHMPMCDTPRFMLQEACFLGVCSNMRVLEGTRSMYARRERIGGRGRLDRPRQPPRSCRSRPARAAARWVPARCHGHVHAECRKEVH